MDSELVPGMRAKFFHPRTMGVMHWGTLLQVKEPEGDKKASFKVRFDVDGKTYWTFAMWIGCSAE